MEKGEHPGSHLRMNRNAPPVIYFAGSGEAGRV